MRPFQIKAGNLKPNLRTTLTNRYGVPADLTGALGLRIYLSRAGSDVVIIDRPADFIDRPNGIVEYVWQQGDTDLPGKFEAEFDVEWADGHETFPNADDDTNIQVHINKAIKSA